jgi:hypothetical protein
MSMPRVETWVLLTTVIVLMMAAGGLAQTQKFYADDPLWQDDDQLDTPEKPEELELSDLYDRFGHIFSDVGSTPIGSEAENINTLDEVPSSSWFTNRHGTNRMSIEELTRGPDTGTSPDPSETWEVFKSKSQGLTPGFQISDRKGVRYVIKLDPVGVPRLSSIAEVVATKLFHAMGYNAPENYIVRIDPANFAIKPGTMVTDQFGDKVPLTEERLRRLLRRVPRLPDGKIRVTASKYIPGRPIGPFRYHSMRSDDPNDVIPHEQRRELRGLRLIAAWLNHDDTRAQNTQDTWVEDNGKHYVRHFLIDFGSTFGSGSVDLQLPNLSFHYWMDLDLIKKNAIGLGLHVPKYRKVKWPRFPEYAAVGRWEGEAFDPEEWKNDYPNPAFVRMTGRDAFWAAKNIMTFTADELRAVVATGQFEDDEQEAYFCETLITRQEKCGRFGINGINPLDQFKVSSGRLSFENLSEKYGFSAGKTTYQIAWSIYNNTDDSVRALGTPSVLTQTSTMIPGSGGLGRDELLLIEIHSLNESFPDWNKRIGVYLRPAGPVFEIVGIERES